MLEMFRPTRNLRLALVMERAEGSEMSPIFFLINCICVVRLSQLIVSLRLHGNPSSRGEVKEIAAYTDRLLYEDNQMTVTNTLLA